MTLRNQVLVWVGLFLLTILVLWVFRPILLPFVIGIALAYLFNPLVNLLQRLHINRGIAAATVLLLVLSALVGLFLMLVPLVVDQVGGLLVRLPSYVSDLQELARTFVPQLTEWLGPGRAEQLESSLAEMIGSAAGIAANLTATLATNSLNLINTLAIFVVTPVVAFYLLLDWDSMVRTVDELLPRAYREEIKGVLHEIDRSMAGVIRGQGSVIVVDCIYYASSLSIVGLNYGLAIGIIAGTLSFVPFLGFVIGFTLSMGIALVQFSSNWIMIAVVFLVFAVGQFLEGNVLYPKLVGSSININPVWLMFALFAFSLLFGFVGLLLAVPLTAIAGVLTRYTIRKYKASSLYTGPSDDGPPALPAVERGHHVPVAAAK